MSRKPRKKDEEGAWGLDRYIWDLYASTAFPFVDKNGCLYINPIPGQIGTAARNNRQFLNDGTSKLANHMRLYFPQGAVHTVTSPESRALQYRPDPTQSTLAPMFKTTKPAAVPWTREEMLFAAKEFEVPADTKILLMFPEIFDRDILLKHPRFHFQYTNSGGQKKIGVKTPCPWCESNAHVSFEEKSGHKRGQHRTIADYRGRIPIYCYNAKCSNPKCSGDPKRATGDDSDKVAAHTFHCYAPHVYANYPDELRARYSSILYTDARDGKSGSNFVTEDLCSEVLKDETNFAELTRHMHEAYERNRRQTIESYVRFIQQQSPTDWSAWPDFGNDNFRSVFQPPSAKIIRDIFDRSYDLVLPHMKRDLYSRVPGSSVKSDGTFEFLSKTSNDEFSSVETKCLHIVWGQYDHILTWAFDGAENDECFQRLHWFLKKRCQRINERHVTDVRYAYSDVCCQGAKDPTNHWITKIWENVKRAPYKDAFHCSQKIVGATQPHHELRETFRTLVSQAFLQYDEDSQRHVARLFQKESKQKLSLEVAQDRVLTKEKYRKKIKNYAPGKEVVEAALEEAYRRLEKADQNKKEEAMLRGDGYMPFLLSHKKNVRLGTRRELDNMLEHVRKGCCEDPVGVDEINVAMDPTQDYPDYIRLRGTSQGESSNRLINKLTNEISHQTAETADKRLWLRVTRYNLEKDKTLQKLLGLRQVRTLEWYLHHAVFTKHPKLSVYDGLEFPGELPDDYFEPIGIEYGRFKDRENLQTILDTLPPVLVTQPETQPARSLAAQPETQPATPLAASQAMLQSQPSNDESSVTIVTAATAAASSTPPNIVASPVATAAAPDQSGTRDYGPQNKWNRRLTPMTAYKVSAGHSYLSENVQFTPYQHDQFWKAVIQARTFLGGEQGNSEKLNATIARIWNETHFQLIRDNVMVLGLNGQIRPSHAKKVLMNKGHELIAARMGGSNPHPKPRRTLKREGVDSLSYMDAAAWLKIIGKPVGNTLPKRKAELMKHFDGQPADYEICQ